MPREVRHDATGPKILDEDDIHEEKGDIAVCRCGLSADRPFCDGSHRATEDEDEETLYKYEGDDDENPRREIAEITYVDETQGVSSANRNASRSGDVDERGSSAHRTQSGDGAEGTSASSRASPDDGDEE